MKKFLKQITHFGGLFLILFLEKFKKKIFFIYKINKKLKIVNQFTFYTEVSLIFKNFYYALREHLIIKIKQFLDKKKKNAVIYLLIFIR